MLLNDSDIFLDCWKIWNTVTNKQHGFNVLDLFYLPYPHWQLKGTTTKLYFACPMTVVATTICTFEMDVGNTALSALEKNSSPKVGSRQTHFVTIVRMLYRRAPFKSLKFFSNDVLQVLWIPCLTRNEVTHMPTYTYIYLPCIHCFVHTVPCPPTKSFSISITLHLLQVLAQPVKFDS